MKTDCLEQSVMHATKCIRHAKRSGKFLAHLKKYVSSVGVNKNRASQVEIRAKSELEWLVALVRMATLGMP